MLAFLPDSLVFVGQFLEFSVGQVLNIDHFVMRLIDGFNDLVQLQMNCPGVTILSVLDQEDHQECDHRRAGVDNQLPGIGVVKVWP